jgi:RimJ/RimL family protein N-acetyltransferase
MHGIERPSGPARRRSVQITMLSDRLRYDPVDAPMLDAFHQLVVDEHVRRYLIDGSLMSREWSADRIRASQDLFRRRGVGLWVVHGRDTNELVGFCGFLEIPGVHPEPQVVYAMFEHHSGKGYATEMARTIITEARRHPGFDRIIAGVDDVNIASRRVLEKLGFVEIAARDGSFGPMRLYALDASAT